MLPSPCGLLENGFYQFFGTQFSLPLEEQFFREESPESRKFKNKDLLKIRAFLQEQKIFAILRERHGIPFPGNLTALKRLQKVSLKRFGCTLIQYSQGKDAGKKLLEGLSWIILKICVPGNFLSKLRSLPVCIPFFSNSKKNEQTILK